MKLERFSFELPAELIAQQPAKPRDHSRLLLVDRRTKKISDHFFYQLPLILKRGDILVLNDSKVIPARLIGRKRGTGGTVEVFIVQKKGQNTAEVMLGHVSGYPGLAIEFGGRNWGEIVTERTGVNGPRLWLMRFHFSSRNFSGFLRTRGQVPTPPYIKQPALWRQYQTIYAHKEGSVAAPTAGLHFTRRLLRRIRGAGISIEYVTLHVGLGTFQPIKTELVEDHTLHAELATIPQATVRRLNAAKKQGRRIIALGTTSVRTLETFATTRGIVQSGSRWTDLFIYPPYRFQLVDGMITNFHLPRSSLLLLVMAFGGESLIRQAYEQAVRKKYRFYSFGDAMMIV